METPKLRVRSDALHSVCTLPEHGEFQFIYAELEKRAPQKLSIEPEQSDVDGFRTGPKLFQ
jgi:hypothetical protein